MQEKDEQSSMWIKKLNFYSVPIISVHQGAEQGDFTFAC